MSTYRLPQSIRYQGTDTATPIDLVACGHGLAVLPLGSVRGTTGAVAGVAAVPVVAPRLVHRVELLHGTIDGAAAVLANALTQGRGES